MISRSFIFFILVFLGFFSVNKLSLNPAYVLGVLFFFLSVVLIDLRYVSKYLIINSLLSIAFLCSFLIGINLEKRLHEVVYLSSFLFCYSIIIGAVCYNVGVFLKKEQRIAVYEKINKTLFIVLVFEFLTRIINPTEGEEGFYKFKESLFYFDSNFTGIVICAFLMLFVFLKEKGIYDIGKFYMWGYIVLLFLTFSRGSILAFLIAYFLVKISGKYYRISSIIISFFVLYVSVRLINYFDAGNDFRDVDLSFNSKFNIIYNTFDIYNSFNFFQKLFGIGLANYINYGGIFAHTILTTFLIEFGVVGMAVFLIMCIYHYTKTKGYLMYLLFPFLINSASLFSAYMVFYFIIVSLIAIEVNDAK